MSFRDYVARVRHEAQNAGIRVPMNHLNDAISFACANRSYSAVMAAEKAGKRPQVTLPPEWLDDVAMRYAIDPADFRKAFAGANYSRLDNPGVRGVEAFHVLREWVREAYFHESEVAITNEFYTELSADEMRGISGLTEEQHHPFDVMAFYWLMCEGSLRIGGREQRTADVCMGEHAPRLLPEGREWLEKLVATPLRAYVVSAVAAGEHLVLRDALGPAGSEVVVAEHSGSRPEMKGRVLGTRVVDCGDHREMSGEIYPFPPNVVPELLDALAMAPNQAAYSHVLRMAWTRLFCQPAHPLRVVDAASGDQVMAVTDSYRCSDWPALCARAAKRRDVHGDAESGWRRYVAGTDGEQHFLAAINPPQDGVVEVFCHSVATANKCRRWFEHLAGELVVFVARECVDPTDEATRERVLAERGGEQVQVRLPPEEMTRLYQELLQAHYEGFMDKPLPIFGNRPPRAMLSTDVDRGRLRALLRSFEANEAGMAARDGREPISFDFLWRAAGLDAPENAGPGASALGQ